MNDRISSFPPLVGQAPKILMLGSMPGAESLAQQQYYAHPRNHFWQLMEWVLQSEAPKDYEERCLWLTKHQIALWDSLQSCQRKGSLDSAIQEAVPNDIAGLLQGNPSINALCFNGTAAQKYCLRFLELPSGIKTLLLPSSSPIPRKGFIRAEDKRPIWESIRQFL